MSLDNKGVSIIVCCYNSAKRLSKTIEYIAKQEVNSGIAWELIVVNNNSKDNTSEVALEEITKYENLSIRYQIVDEPKPGLSYARDKGVSVAKFEYIIFCDDDNWLEKDYLQTAYNILGNNNRIAAVGGQSEGISDIIFPDWWEDYKGGYAVGKQAERSGDISIRKYLWGSGLAFRKGIYLKAFEKHPSLLTDRKGKELSSGGDSEICMRFLLMGYQLYYDERLKFKHYIASNKLTWQYRKKLFQGFTDASVIMSAYGQYLDILTSSKLNRIKNLSKNILKILLAIIFKTERFYTANEANFIFLATGITLGKTSIAAKSIKKFNSNAVNRQVIFLEKS